MLAEARRELELARSIAQKRERYTYIAICLREYMYMHVCVYVLIDTHVYLCAFRMLLQEIQLEQQRNNQHR